MNKLKILIILLGLIPSIIFSNYGNQKDQLILRGATLNNSTGAPPIGPVDIVIENNIIKNIQVVGYPGVEINENRRIQSLQKMVKKLIVKGHIFYQVLLICMDILAEGLMQNLITFWVVDGSWNTTIRQPSEWVQIGF